MSNIKQNAVGSNSFNGRFDPNHRVDIKEIRKKFENLSNGTESKMSEKSYTPIAPTRRKKSDGSSVNFEKVPSSDSKFQTNLQHDAPIPDKITKRLSVKEKSKMFESSTEFKLQSNSASKLSKDKFYAVSKAEDDIKCQNNRKTLFCDTVCYSDVSTPPAKPPRSFASTAEKISNENCEVPRKSSLPNFQTVIKLYSDCTPELKSRKCFSFDANSGEQNKTCSRINNTTEIQTDSPKKIPLSTPKSIKTSGKTQTVINYFKNISSISNICEKVKQKQQGIFIDLTPTTVSPPKHYGTLKKSLSDEHIYAEPAAVYKTDANKSPDQAAQPLHYMCTSLVPPALPHRDKSEENKVTSRQSVRNMIYGSFAGIRAASKENPLNTPVADSCESDVCMKAIQARIIYVKSVKKQISSSSMCLAPKLYEALFIVNVIDDQPQVTHTFPLKVAEEYNIPLLPHICFPQSGLWKSVSMYHSETFYFTLMNKDDTICGYCLRIQGWPETGYANETLCVKVPVAICILSSFSAPVFYKKLLFEIEKHLILPRNNCFKYIRSLQKLGVPNAGASLSVPDCSEPGDEANRIIISRPLDSHFVGIEMTRTLQLLDVDILVKCVASLFLERRILFFSASTSNLYHCCKAISSLLYPFEWPHEIVPVLPSCLTIHCCSEQPYVLGIANNNCDSVLELLAEHELLIIDVDKGAVIKSCNDEDTILPKRVQKAVISALNLAKNMTDPTEMLRDIMISEAFVHMSVEMIGHYENHFTEVNGNVIFQKEGFLKNACSYNIRSFLQWFTETQMFDSFIEESLWRMKYRNICQTSMRTFFEKRVDEYKWELSHDGEKLSRIIGKTVRNFGEMLKGLKKSSV